MAQKKYYYFQIVLQPQNKVVKDMAYNCTEKRMHEIAFELCTKLEQAGMAYNGKNANHYYEVVSQEVPSPEELAAMELQ